MRRQENRSEEMAKSNGKREEKNTFHVIDMESWPRREHFAYYTEKLKTGYQMTVEIDVTKLRKRCKKLIVRFYPAMIYAIMRAVNQNEAFRIAYNEKGELGYYEVCHPSYTIFHEDDQTFSDIWTPYHESFDVFYDAVLEDMERYQDVKGVKAKPGRPDAFTCISCVPWITFRGLSHDTRGKQMFFPIIDFGKYYKTETKSRILPLSIYVNHAAADGYHTAKLLNDIQYNCTHCKEWMQ